MTSTQRAFLELVRRAEPMAFVFPLPGNVQGSGAGHRVASSCELRGWITREGFTRARLTDAGRDALRKEIERLESERRYGERASIAGASVIRHQDARIAALEAENAALRERVAATAGSSGGASGVIDANGLTKTAQAHGVTEQKET